jgi:hypothetical protein
MALQRAVRCGAWGVGWRAFPTRASEKIGRSKLPDLEEVFDTLNLRALESAASPENGGISAKCAVCPSFLAGNCATPATASGTGGCGPTGDPGAVVGRVAFP